MIQTSNLTLLAVNIPSNIFFTGKKQIGSSVKDRNKLKRFVKACSLFYACISSWLIKPELHSEIGAINGNRRFLVQTLTTKDCKGPQTNVPKNVGSMKT